jgi:flagellar basal body-associated protein FliL
MHASQSAKRPPGRKGALVALLVLLVAAVAGLAFWLHRSRPAAREARSLATPVRGTYKNRALVPQAEPPSAEQALPTIQGNVYDTQGALLPGARVVALTYDTAGNMATPAAAAESDA